jgi:membrane protein
VIEHVAYQRARWSREIYTRAWRSAHRLHCCRVSLETVQLSWSELARRTWRDSIEDDVLGLAAQLAYYFFLALFPAILFLLALASFLPLSNLTDDVGRLLAPFVSPSVLGLIQEQMTRLADNQDGGLVTFGVLGALWSSSAAIVSIVGALNRAYDIEEGRPWWKVRLLAIGLTLAVALLVLLAFSLVLLGPTVAEWLGRTTGWGPPFQWTWLILQWPLVFGLITTSIGLLYYYGPDADQDWVWITPGAVTATVLWLVASLLFKLYIANFTNYEGSYGTVGGVIVVLLWFYVSGLAILAGAELNAEIEHASPYGKAPGQKNAQGKLMIGRRAARAFAERHDANTSTRTAKGFDSRHKSPSMEPANPGAEMQLVLDALESLGGQPVETLSPEEARVQPTPADAVKRVLEQQGKSTAPEPVADVQDRVIESSNGPIPIRIYWPKGDAPFPVVFYIHGGGWVIADLDTYDASARALANAAEAIVVSTHYRQGPEHPYPAAHDDVFAAYVWTLKYAGSLKGDPGRVAVAGESAGGNMAAVVSIRAREQKLPVPVHQLLVYPVAGTDMNTESYREHATAKPLNKAMMQWFAKYYLGDEAVTGNAEINLATRADLMGLPPTTVITAEIDPLRSDGDMLAEALGAADVPVTARNFEGVTHEFFAMGAVVPAAKTAVAFAAGELKKSFAATRKRTSVTR